MNFMMVEKLGSVSMRNGVIRIQCIATAADGQDQVTGELVIPANSYGQVVGGLQSAAKELQERLAQAQKDQANQTEN